MKRRIMKYLLPLLTGSLLSLAGTAHATNWYMSVSGSGAKTGVDWANAFASSTANTRLNTTMVAGDTLYMASGTYQQMQIKSSGSAAARKRLTGVDTGKGLPTVIGNGYGGLWVGSTGTAAHYWTIQNLKFYYCSTSLGATNANGLVLDNLAAYLASEHFSFNSCDNLLVKNCRADRFSENGFRVNYDCNNLAFRNCVGDASGTGLVDDPAWGHQSRSFNFHTKFSTNPFNTNILLEDCEALNNRERATAGYSQGDGYMFEQSNDGVTLQRCKSRLNDDAAYDMKGANQSITDCIGLQSRSGFKAWYSGTFNNCFSGGNWEHSMLLANPSSTGYSLTANKCTFYGGGNYFTGVHVENPGGTNTIYLNNCINARSAAVGAFRSSKVNYGTAPNDTKEYSNTSIATNPPLFSNPTLTSFVLSNFNNATWGTAKGCTSTYTGNNEGGGINFEGEECVPVTGTPTPNTYSLVDASGGVYSNLPGSAVGNYISYTVNVPAAGTYTVKARFRTQYNRGIAQLSINTVNQGSPTDTYAADPGGFKLVDLGTKVLAAGNNTFKWTLTGKNGSSSGYSYSIDYIKLIKQ